MRCLTACFALVSISAHADQHADVNPVYRALCTEGVSIGNEQIRLPAPKLADGADAATQQAVLDGIVDDRHSVAEFVRKSVVAPQIIEIRGVEGSATIARQVDLWYVAYGELDDMVDPDMLERTNLARGRNASIHVLTDEELRARGIDLLQSSAEQQQMVHTSVSILDRVELRQTSETLVSRTADSVVIASRLDPRFADDADFPNQYQRVLVDELGKTSLASPQPYDGAGSYLKATRLIRPEGALLVEYHMVYAEPQDWFNGANLLASKLPIHLQSTVRTVRRQLRNADDEP